MGCKITKSEHDSEENPSETMATAPNETMTHSNNSKKSDIDYKSRLEWKMCLAKDTPEPEFDLTDCMLKDVPSGVFVVCRVLRKEHLKLGHNILRSLNGGGALTDLSLLRTLNLNFNRFTKLPDDLYELENLRELFISNNQLEILPNTLNKLQNLEHLDVSHNRLKQLTQINCMPQLKILNISGNLDINILPNELSTCDSIIDIILDVEVISFPPREICQRGTREIMNFLLTGKCEVPVINAWDVKENVVRQTVDFIAVEKGEDVAVAKNWQNAKEKYTKGNTFMERERIELERYSNLEAQLHLEQQKRKQELLQHLMEQQTESENLVQRMQQEKDTKLMKLVNDVLKAEEKAAIAVQQLLTLRSGPDGELLAQEQREQEQLLEHLRITHSDLRKKDILSAMTDLLENETKQIQTYNEKRDIASRTLLEQDLAVNSQLDEIFRSNDRDRLATISNIMQNEELQKIAVATLIEKNDSRSWGLIEQVRIVELQLAAMTQYEIERREMEVDERLVDLSEKRLDLTYILIDLLDQQAKRKQELHDTMLSLELQKENQQQDFWLLQYQKLIDSQPCELNFKSSSIDPLLGYQFLINGVVHCIPFLSKMWQSKFKDLDSVTEADLIEAGIRNIKDRYAILKSIQEHLHQNQQKLSTDEKAPSAPTADAAEEAKESTEEAVNENEKTQAELLSECVVCMEEVCKIIFLPCGHLCCCINCHTSIQLCPMCRATIDRRIKVVQA